MGKPVKTEFTISYDDSGDLKDHLINARDLGAAITGMYDLITKAAEIVSNGSSSADLKVIAPAKEGSLEILFVMLADPLTTTTVLKSIGIGVAAAATSAGTALGIMDRLKDKKIDRVVINSKSQTAKLETSDGTFETTSHVAQLVSSREIRQALHKVIQVPLQGRDDAKISFITKKQKVTLNDDKINNFTQIRSDVTEKETKKTYQKVVQFTKLNFKSKRGWTIQSRDGLEVGVSIQDTTFMQKVAASEEAFEKEKSYTVEIEETVTTNISGTKTKYSILRVINELSH